MNINVFDNNWSKMSKQTKSNSACCGVVTGEYGAYTFNHFFSIQYMLLKSTTSYSRYAVQYTPPNKIGTGSRRMTMSMSMRISSILS